MVCAWSPCRLLGLPSRLLRFRLGPRPLQYLHLGYLTRCHPLGRHHHVDADIHHDGARLHPVPADQFGVSVEMGIVLLSRDKGFDHVTRGTHIFADHTVALFPTKSMSVG